jgi:hypothetical protein
MGTPFSSDIWRDILNLSHYLNIFIYVFHDFSLKYVARNPRTLGFIDHWVGNTALGRCSSADISYRLQNGKTQTTETMTVLGLLIAIFGVECNSVHKKLMTYQTIATINDDEKYELGMIMRLDYGEVADARRFA